MWKIDNKVALVIIATVIISLTIAVIMIISNAKNVKVESKYEKIDNNIGQQIEFITINNNQKLNEEIKSNIIQ